MTTLKSGEECTLSQLFSGNRKIIIPDLQRDYCWGDQKHGSEAMKIELVSGFVTTLLEGFIENRNEQLMLGLIYGFENPTNHIHLCDGQQRITTLFLLLGMLCRKNICNSTSNHLISKFELEEDDKEPYLQYSIRESTLYFLSDLVCNFFIKRECKKVEDINKTSWYFNSYNEDPSIQSMLSALVVIEKILNDEKDVPERKEKIDWIDFNKYLEDTVFFLYVDLENRENGEDLFVIINTTGEPLTATENLKPILLGSLSDDEDLNNQWEERESFFWVHKKENEHEADDGHRDLISWYIKISQEQNEIQILNYFKQIEKKGEDELVKELKTIHTYFEKYKKLISLIETDSEFDAIIRTIRERKSENIVAYTRDFTFSDDKKLDQQQNILLPLLVFSVNISDSRDDLFLFLRRLRKNYFDKQLVNRNGKYFDWRYILQIIKMKNSLQEILCFKPSESHTIKKIANVDDFSTEWYNAEEQIKDIFKKNESYKKSIEIWEDHPDFKGDISTIFKIYLINELNSEISNIDFETNVFNNQIFPELERYYNNYRNLERLTFEKNGNEAPNLANYYRLFKVFTNCTKIGGIYRTSGMEGVQFSERNRNHLRSAECLRLYKSNNPIEFIKNFIIGVINSESIFHPFIPFSIKKFIKGWLTLKVFNAEEKNVFIFYHDGKETGIAAYTDLNRNHIFKNEPISFANSLCGFAIKSGGGGGNFIRYAEDKKNWLNTQCLDTPFAGIDFEMFRNRKSVETHVAQKAIEENNAYITKLLANNGIVIEQI